MLAPPRAFILPFVQKVCGQLVPREEHRVASLGYRANRPVIRLFLYTASEFQHRDSRRGLYTSILPFLVPLLPFLCQTPSLAPGPTSPVLTSAGWQSAGQQIQQLGPVGPLLVPMGSAFFTCRLVLKLLLLPGMVFIRSFVMALTLFCLPIQLTGSISTSVINL